MRTNLLFLSLFTLAATLALTSCSGTARYKNTGPPAPSPEIVVSKNGPPPHAPAHGYRHKHGNIVLVYQSSLGIYAVDGHQGYYFLEGHFYRRNGSKWQVSAQFEGPWKKVSKAKLPKELKNNKL
jgi:hypothetical protein